MELIQQINNPKIIYYFFTLISIIIGYFISRGLIDTKKDKSAIAPLIKVFAGFGIGVSSFGLMFLIYSSTDYYPQNDENNTKNWELTSIILDENNKIIEQKRIKKENFNDNTLKINDDISKTLGVIFTIAGIALGALGVLWLGHLESTRLNKDRDHDQNKQKDRLLSLLSLGIDLFIYIDEKILDFMYDYDINDKKSFSKIKNKDKIEYDKRYYIILNHNIIKNNSTLKLAYNKHLTSLFKFLYDSKGFERNTILKDVHKIIDELKILYYEKDIILYDKKENKKENIYKRKLFIQLLNEYNDYINFISGNTIQSDFAINEYSVFDKKLSTLLNSDNSDNSDISDNPIAYLYKKYENMPKNTIFYNYFIESISKEFSETYLKKESNIFNIFNIPHLKDIFVMMNISNLEDSKFFNIYFKMSFDKYINEKKQYTQVNLYEKDLDFDEYITIVSNAFLQIDSDIKSAKELHSLFISFVKLYNEFKEGSENE